jgi:hypothetical protein
VLVAISERAEEMDGEESMLEDQCQILLDYSETKAINMHNDSLHGREEEQARGLQISCSYSES